MVLSAVPTSFWRKELPVLDDYRQVVKGGLFEHQREWWDLPNFVKLLVGGYGCGKTAALCKRGIALALYNAPCPVGMVSPTYPMAKQTILETLDEMLEGKARLMPRFSYRSNKSGAPIVYWLRYGRRVGRIWVYSGEKPDRLKGANLAAALIDEPFIQDVRVFEQMSARVRHPRARQLEIDLAGTPEQLGWGYELVEGELADKYDVGFVRGATKYNLTLADGYYERLLASYDEKTARAYLEGHFENLTAGRVYHAFDRERNIGEPKRPETAKDILGMDFNVDPMAFLVGWADIPSRQLHWSHEYEQRNSDTEEACAEVREKHPTVRDCYPDASGKSRATNAPGGLSDFDYIRKAGFRLHVRHDGNPLRRDRYNAANGLFKAADGRTGFTIHPRCKKLKRNLLAYSHEQMNTDAHKAMSHLLDAATYAPAFLFPVDRKRARKMRVAGV